MNIVLWASPCFVMMLFAELYVTKKHSKHTDTYDYKDMFTSLIMGAGAGIIKVALVKTLSAAIIFNAVYHLFNKNVGGVDMNIMGYESFGLAAAWYVWLICQFLDDFCYYWVHRFNHTIRFMWAAHIVHHSSAKFNYCLLYTSPSPRDGATSRMPSSA